MSGPTSPALPWPGGDGLDDLPETWLRGRPGVKWAEAGPSELPAWVADMDFPAPEPAVRALAAMAEVADFGYGRPQLEEVERCWAARMVGRFGWAPAPGRLRLFTDVVQAVQVLLHLLTAPGDGVLVLTPSYPVFVATLWDMGRPLLAVPATLGRHGWSFDLDQARAAAADAKALLLVNPHNPTGRVLSAAELEALGELADGRDLLVISDEVHAELVLDTSTRHVPFASLSDSLAARTVTLYSASKAFNLGGMCCALAHLGPATARAEVGRLPSHLLGRVSTAALATTLACWTAAGDEWLDRCLARLRANRDEIGRWLGGPGGEVGVRGAPPQATYLQWLDFRATSVAASACRDLREKAGVVLSDGPSFGPGGDGWGRLNFATSPAVLDGLLGRITSALA